MKSALKSVLKRGALVTMTTALAVTGLAATAGTANAAPGGPGGSTNIRGVDPGDTDLMIERLCSQEADDDGRVHGSLNVETGQFRTYDEVYAEAERLGHSPTAPWEYFSGYCTYPQASTWSIKGETVRTSRWIGNQGTTGDKETIVRNYTTKTSAKKSVGAKISLSFAKGLFGGGAESSFSYEWGWEKSSSFELRSEKSIPACAQIATTWTPYQRVVRVNPVFNVTSYSWHKGGDPNDSDSWENTTTWRGRDASWQKIYSHGYYIDGVSDKLLPDGSPDGREDKIQENLDPSKCAK
ncbi:hypothetical protein [Streptomyces ureilyticus]|uniref:Uncharacterized protein n=1 Tax=Streptomyces ureilyticus TaxID=1775131 RepID=A0ABX0DX70_9ACTN|nr:hypothetical protein [Streptomyces ureilyticus]NGO46526.1 hypothetical protein [Streptomyces ureilyticus]